LPPPFARGAGQRGRCRSLQARRWGLCKKWRPSSVLCLAASDSFPPKGKAREECFLSGGFLTSFEMTIVCHPDRAKRAEGSPVLASPFCPRCGPKGEVPKPSGEAVGVMQKVAPLISPVPGGFGQLPPQGEGKRGMFSLWGISHFVRNDNSVSSRPNEVSGGIPKKERGEKEGISRPAASK